MSRDTAATLALIVLLVLAALALVLLAPERRAPDPAPPRWDEIPVQLPGQVSA